MIDGNQQCGSLRSMTSWIKFAPPLVASQAEMSTGHSVDFGFRLAREAPEAPAVNSTAWGGLKDKIPEFLEAAGYPSPLASLGCILSSRDSSSS